GIDLREGGEGARIRSWWSWRREVVIVNTDDVRRLEGARGQRGVRQRSRREVVQSKAEVRHVDAAPCVGHQDDLLSLRSDEQDVQIAWEGVREPVEVDADPARHHPVLRNID